MRLSSVFAIAGVFAAAALVALVSARFTVTTIEKTSRTAVLRGLDHAGLTWSEVETDGLQVYLAGTAPSEAARFRALSVAGSAVDAARLIDQMLVEEYSKIAAPKFSMEILRNDSGISLIGLVPAAMDRAAFLEEIEKVSENEPVSDFLEAADYPAPPTWEETTAFALRSLRDLERTKISLDAERISVTAITPSEDAKARIEADLARRAPESISLSMAISAPRPVITPFTLRFVIDETGPHFDACSADTAAARAEIVSAAQKAGMETEANCTIGLGVPTPAWGDTVSQSIAALAELGGGAVTFSDADISLLAPEGTKQSKFDNIVGQLESNLPEIFALTAVLPEAEGEEEAPEFVATLSPEGLVQLRGRIGSAADRKLIDSFAMARFTTDGVDMAARVDEAMPSDWTYRIMAALDSLAYLSNGVARVEPDNLTITGATGQEDAGTMIASLLSETLETGAKFSIDVDYLEKLDPVANLPTPENCIENIEAILAADKIRFEPGSANLDVAGKGIMDKLAEVLRECGEMAIEIGGHTDSQGREEMNQQLSQNRAQTVLSELRMRRVLTGSITAVGYGESQPIADNEEEEGREANRRIEFKMIKSDGATETEVATSGEEAEEQETDEGTTETGETDEQN